jgi:hypothetical protein
MAGQGAAQSRPGASRTAAVAALRRGETVLMRMGADLRSEVVRLAPTTRPDGVRAGDMVLARTGLLPDGPGRLVLEEVKASRADVARLDGSGWVLLENIFGRVVSDGE